MNNFVTITDKKKKKKICSCQISYLKLKSSTKISFHLFNGNAANITGFLRSFTSPLPDPNQTEVAELL